MKENGNSRGVRIHASYYEERWGGKGLVSQDYDAWEEIDYRLTSTR